ncbi:hypothetical protein [Kaistella sp.]|uniref:hypothetical protein n=1 Tax=Kaistella sp. TaxID=2782235 RepID=UPI0035A1723E
MKAILFIFLLIFSTSYHAENTKLDFAKTDKKLYLITEKFSLIDFGAVGDGTTDDSGAFIKAITAVSKSSSKTLLIPGNFIFNLSNKTIDFAKHSNNIILQFNGGILINGNLVGSRTRVNAQRIKIFENIILSGTFTSVTGYAYPEWFGAFPFDNRLNLVDALRKLDPVFFDIQLGAGDYFTQDGEYLAKGLSGIAMGKSNIIWETDKSNTYLFSLGMVGGQLKNRTFDYNYIKNLTLFITKKSRETKLKGNTGIIIGASHKPFIENVNVKQSLDYQRFNRSDLQEFISDEKKLNDANVGIEFKGDSELSILNNITTYADVGILFSQYTDMASVTNYINDCGPYGLANVYFTKHAVQSQSILFNGTQSWNRGLYGFYSEDSNLWNTFRNNRFENIRIEQLTAEIVKNKKVVSTSIRIGKSNLIANLIFENIILSGASNGIFVGETASGNIFFDKVFLYPDITIKRDFAIKTKMVPPRKSPDETPFNIHLKNIDLYRDSPSIFENSQNSALQRNTSQQNKFSDLIIAY